MLRLSLFHPCCSFDANGDGHITQKELKKIVKDIYGMLDTGDAGGGKEDAARRDSNSSGSNGGSSRGSSFKRSFKKKDITDQAFKEMDANNDGKVSNIICLLRAYLHCDVMHMAV